MTALYKRVEEREEVKPAVTSVKFNADYDITDVLTLWGNWARKDAYLQRKAFSLFKSQKNEWKECCNDDDGLLIDSVIAALSKLKTNKSQDEYQVLRLYYYGLETVIDDIPMIIPQSLRAIAKIIGISKSQIDFIKSSGESCIVGMLAMQTMLTGQEIEILQKIRLLK